MKKLHYVLLCVVLALALSISAFATYGSVTKNLYYRDIKITLDGKTLTPKDANGNIVEPFIIDGTTYLPVRAISEALGMGVAWDSATSTVVLTTTGNQNTDQSISDDPTKQVDVLGQYARYDSFGDIYQYLIVKNTSNVTLEISSNVLAKNASGTVVGSASASEVAVGSGEVICLTHYFTNVEKGQISFKSTLSVKPDSIYSSVADSLSVLPFQGTEKVTVLVTNNGSKAAQFVEVTALFLKDGKLIYADSNYVCDVDYELKPGITLATDINAYQTYDEVLVYAHGRALK